MQERLGTNRLVADFFTHSYRISGSLNVRQKKLADQLNDQNTAFLVLENVYLSCIEHPAEIATSHPVSTLRKSNIVAIIAASRDDGLPREHTYGSYFGSQLTQVFITVPHFEIKGHLRIAGRWDVRTVLTTGTDDFITILDGQMRSADHPATTFTGGAILVNKARIEAICEAKE